LHDLENSHKFRPTFILSDRSTLPDELRSLQDSADFLSTFNGWITKRTFVLYAHFLADQLREYWRSLSLVISNQRFLVILDGHSSRFTIEVIQFLDDEGVDVIVLPTHCTHVLQPFDVGIPSPLKAYLAQFFHKSDLMITEEATLELANNFVMPHWVAGKQKVLFQAFIWAWDTATTVHNIASAFKKAGIIPLDIEAPLQNPSTRQSRPDELFPDPPDSLEIMNITFLISSDRFAVLAARSHRLFTNKDPVTEAKKQCRRLVCSSCPEGRFLASSSQFLWRKKCVTSADGMFQRPRIMVHRWNGFSPEFMWRTDV
jgi:hypothetical protein